MADRVPFHSGQVKNVYILSLNKVNTILYFILINYYEPTMPFCMEMRVDPDQLTLSEAS